MKKVIKVSLPEEKTIKPNFIVGRWYKYKDCYIKYKETACGLFKSSEEITDYKKYYKSTGSYGKADHEKVLLEELSEIQQYLPDGHPDKVSKPSIPEYVECISQLLYAVKGKIYPVVSDTCCICEDGFIYSWNSYEFKPSTKAKYEAQFTKKFKVGDYVISDYSYLTLPRHRVSQVLEVCNTGRIKLEQGEFSPNNFRLATPGEIHPKLTEKIEYTMYDAFVSDPLPTKKPLIENVQSVNVNLRTKKNNNKFKF